MPVKLARPGRAAAASILALGLLGLGACARDAQLAGIPLWPQAVQARAPASGGAAGADIGVNGYLWSATLQTLVFMPLASADPYGGVINYDWYINPAKPDERLKATVFILDSRLRADGINVAVFRQTQGPGGAWVDAPTSPQTATDLENAILAKARELRNANPRS